MKSILLFAVASCFAIGSAMANPPAKAAHGKDGHGQSEEMKKHGKNKKKDAHGATTEETAAPAPEHH